MSDERPARAHGEPEPGHEEIRQDDEVVDEASEDSFPASDPPSYSGTTAGSVTDEDDTDADEDEDPAG